MLNIVIGYDPNETVAYHVLAHSLMRHASHPITVTPLYLPQLISRGYYTRERDPLQSTDFTYSRFLTPWLTGARFGDRSIFMDCDMLCRADIYEVLDYCDPYKDVQVVKHDYLVDMTPKFLGQEQTSYPCKNWSSFMVFNPHRSAVQRLTPDYVNLASASDLHQFKWAREVGALPFEWNHLVGEYSPNPNAKIVHFTRGGPWFPDYENCEFAEEWRDELSRVMYAKK